MSWVRFTADYNYRKPAFTIAYKAGMVQNVTAECATLAIADGKAIRLRKTRKDEEPHDDVANDSIQSAPGPVSDNPGADNNNV